MVHLHPMCCRHHTAQTVLAAGKLGEPENLYKNATNGIPYKVNSLFPASKGEVRESDKKLGAAIQESYNQNAKLAAEFSEYKNETTALINSLVVEVNSLTPVRSLFILYF